MYRPRPGEQWALKSDPKKVLTVRWTNSCNYVQYIAPWTKRRVNGCELKTFHKRYERVTTNQGE